MKCLHLQDHGLMSRGSCSCEILVPEPLKLQHQVWKLVTLLKTLVLVVNVDEVNIQLTSDKFRTKGKPLNIPTC